MSMRTVVLAVLSTSSPSRPHRHSATAPYRAPRHRSRPRFRLHRARLVTAPRGGLRSLLARSRARREGARDRRTACVLHPRGRAVGSGRRTAAPRDRPRHRRRPAGAHAARRTASFTPTRPSRTSRSSSPPAALERLGRPAPRRRCRRTRRARRRSRRARRSSRPPRPRRSAATATGKRSRSSTPASQKSHPFLQQSPGVPRSSPRPATRTATARAARARARPPARARPAPTRRTRAGTAPTSPASPPARAPRSTASPAAAGLIAIQVFSRFDGATDCARRARTRARCRSTPTSSRASSACSRFATRSRSPPPTSASAAAVHERLRQRRRARPAIDNLRSAGIATVIASGNDGFTNAVNAPGCISTAITVGATGDTDASPRSRTRARWSTSSPRARRSTRRCPRAPDRAGPTSTSSTAPRWPRRTWPAPGRSPARPNPSATVTQVENAFKQTGKPVTDTLASPPITRDRIRALAARRTSTTPDSGRRDPSGRCRRGVASNGIGLARRTSTTLNPTTGPRSGNITITRDPLGRGRARRLPGLPGRSAGPIRPSASRA